MELYDYWGIKAQDERGKLQAAYEKGEQKGGLEKAKQTARKMLSKGYDISEITELTGLSADFINGLSEA